MVRPENAVENLLEATRELASDNGSTAELRAVAAQLWTHLNAYIRGEDLCLPTEHITKATASFAKAHHGSRIFFSAIVAVLSTKESILSLLSEEVVDLLVAFDILLEHGAENRLATEETCTLFMKYVVEPWCEAWRD